MYRAERLSRFLGELPYYPYRVHIYQPFRITPADYPNLKILNSQLVLMILLKLRNVHIYLSMFLKRKQII